MCVLEGPDLVASALDAGAEFEAIYVDASFGASSDAEALIDRAGSVGVRVFGLSAGVLERVADASTPQPVLAAVRFPLASLDSIEASGLILVLHDVRDPGNAGTLVRSADAAGATAVIFTGHSVDPFNSKTLRATAGSIFHVPVAVSDLEAALGSFSARGASTLASVVRGGVSHREVDFSEATVVVIGNESEGLDNESIARCERTISIEMAGRSESLNAGVAGSLIAFEALWQRQDRDRVSPRPSL